MWDYFFFPQNLIHPPYASENSHSHRLASRSGCLGSLHGIMLLTTNMKYNCSNSKLSPKGWFFTSCTTL